MTLLLWFSVAEDRDDCDREHEGGRIKQRLVWSQHTRHVAAREGQISFDIETHLIDFKASKDPYDHLVQPPHDTGQRSSPSDRRISPIWKFQTFCYLSISEFSIVSIMLVSKYFHSLHITV